MLNNLFLNKFSFLILLIPAFLITGPFLPDLILSISAIIFVSITVINKNYKVYNNLFVKFFFIFWLYLIFSSFMSIDIFPSLKSSFFYFRFGLLVLMLNFLIQNNKHFESRMIKVCFFSIMAVVVSCLFEFTLIRYNFIKQLYNIYIITDSSNFMVQSNALINTINNRISGIFGTEGIAGSYILRLLPFFFIYSLSIFKKKYNTKNIITYNLFFLLIIFIVLNTGERASFVLLVFSIILHFLIIKKIRNIFKYSLIASVFILLISLNYDPILKGRIIHQTKYQLQYFDDNSKISDKKTKIKEDRFFIISEMHEGHLYAAWKIFLDNKIIGSGMKGFRNECYNSQELQSNKKVYCTTHPHNILLQFLSETGIIGTLFYLFILVVLMIEIFKKIFFSIYKNKSTNHRDDIKNCILICILINLWPLATSGNFFNNWLSIIYYFPIILYLKDHRILNNEKNL